MSIRKFRAARVNSVTAQEYVGQPGDLFYDETTGQLHVSDGTTPGGHFVNLVIATSTVAGAIKAGPGANVAADGTLTINTAGLPLSIGDLSIVQANISTVNPNEDLGIISNGTGNVNIIGNLRLFSTNGDAFSYGKTPIMSVDNTGNMMINSSLTNNGNVTFVGTSTFIGPIVSVGTRISTGDSIFVGNITANGNSTFNGTVRFVGDTTHTGNLTANGNLTINGPSYFIGNVTEVGNLTVTGNAVNNGHSIFNGDTVFAGNMTRTGTFLSTGNVTYNGNMITNGSAVNNGPTTFNGNITITGNTRQTGDATYIVTTNSMYTGGIEVTGNTQGLSQPPVLSGVLLHLTGRDDGVTSGKMYIDSNQQYSILVGRRFNGTIANPTQVLAGDEVLRIAATGYPTGGWPATGIGQIRFIADENQTQTNRGGHLEFWTMPIGSNVIANTMSVSATSGVTVSGNATATSFVETVTSPTVVSNAYTLNLATCPNMIILNNGTTAFTITLTNPIPGKRVVIAVLGIGGTKVTVNGLTTTNSFNNSNQFAGLNGPTGDAVVELISTTGANAGVYMTSVVAK